MASGSKRSGWFESNKDPVGPVCVPLRLKERVAPVPVEGFGKDMALVTARAAGAETGSFPHTKVPLIYPVAWAQSV